MSESGIYNHKNDIFFRSKERPKIEKIQITRQLAAENKLNLGSILTHVTCELLFCFYNVQACSTLELILTQPTYLDFIYIQGRNQKIFRSYFGSNEDFAQSITISPDLYLSSGKIEE